MNFPGNMSIAFMGAYEKIKSLEFSLKTICAVDVVHRILDSVGTKINDYPEMECGEMPEHVNEDASKRVENLHLPVRLKELLAGLIKPIYLELNLWHNIYSFDVCPTWSPHGTVDLVRSTGKVVDDPRFKTSYRFIIACAFCHERQIFELARQLTEQEMADIVGLPWKEWYHKLSRHNPDPSYSPEDSDQPLGLPLNRPWRELTLFWTNVIGSGGFLASRETCKKGLEVSLDTYNEAATAYFLGKGDPEATTWALSESVVARHLREWQTLSPGMHCLLFSKISDEDQRRRLFDDFNVSKLLCSLVEWPYQPLFLDAARSLSVHANDRAFLESLEYIAFKDVEGFKDFDCRGLFVRLFQTIESLRPGFSLGACSAAQSIAISALVTEDELWMNFVFGKFSEREKERLMLENCSHVFTLLVFEGRAHLFEQFFRRCAGRGIDSLLKIFDTWPFREGMKPKNLYGKSKEAMDFRLILDAVNKIITERVTANNGAMPD